MDLGLAGRVAVVTGGAKGIGRAEALALAGEGASVVVVDLDPSGANLAVELGTLGVEAMAVRADVSDPAAVRAMSEAIHARFGRIDILVNNAGIFGAHLGKGIAELPEESWTALLGVHLGGTFLCTKYISPYMVSRRWGRIINTSSIHASSGARRGMASYTAAKGGIESFTRTAAKELGGEGITVNAVAPGFVRTSALTFTPEQYASICRQVPAGRLGEPEDIADCVLFLASQQAAYINGTILTVNGGRTEYWIES